MRAIGAIHEPAIREYLVAARAANARTMAVLDAEMYDQHAFQRAKDEEYLQLRMLGSFLEACLGLQSEVTV